MSIREKIAVPVCIASAVAGGLLIYRGYKPFDVLFGLSLLWAIIGQWLNTHRFKYLRSNVSEIHDAAKQRGLYSSPLARAVSQASFFIGMGAVVCWFKS